MGLILRDHRLATRLAGMCLSVITPRDSCGVRSSFFRCDPSKVWRPVYSVAAGGLRAHPQVTMPRPAILDLHAHCMYPFFAKLYCLIFIRCVQKNPKNILSTLRRVPRILTCLGEYLKHSHECTQNIFRIFLHINIFI